VTTMPPARPDRSTMRFYGKAWWADSRSADCGAAGRLVRTRGGGGSRAGGQFACSSTTTASAAGIHTDASEGAAYLVHDDRPRMGGVGHPHAECASASRQSVSSPCLGCPLQHRQGSCASLLPQDPEAFDRKACRRPQRIHLQGGIQRAVEESGPRRRLPATEARCNVLLGPQRRIGDLRRSSGAGLKPACEAAGVGDWTQGSRSERMCIYWTTICRRTTCSTRST